MRELMRAAMRACLRVQQPRVRCIQHTSIRMALENFRSSFGHLTALPVFEGTLSLTFATQLTTLGLSVHQKALLA